MKGSRPSQRHHPETLINAQLNKLLNTHVTTHRMTRWPTRSVVLTAMVCRISVLTVANIVVKLLKIKIECIAVGSCECKMVGRSGGRSFDL